MSLGEFVGIYELNGFDGRVTHVIHQFMNGLEDQARNRSIFIAGWEIMEDELRFILMLRGDPETSEVFANDIEAGLGKLLQDMFGISIQKLVLSRVTDVTPPPEVLTNLRLDIKKIHDFQRIFHSFREEINVQRFQKLLREQGQKVEGEHVKLFVQLALFEEEFDTEVLRLSPLGYGVQKFFSEVLTCCHALYNILQVDYTFPLLYLLKSSEGKLSEVKLLELFMLLLQHEPEILEKAFCFLVEKNYIHKMADESLTVSEKGTAALAQFSTVVKAITEEQKAHNVVSKAFASIDRRVKYVIKRSGIVEAFTFGKILESLVRGGIEYDISLSTVDALSDLFGLSDVVGADEVVSSIKRKLTEHDLTRERAERYNFYVNTHSYLSWNVDGQLMPFDRAILEKRLISRWFSLPNYSYGGSVVRGLASKIYDVIRSLYAVIIPYWSERGEDLPIELSPDLICRVIDDIVSKAIPVLACIPKKPSKTTIDESIYSLVSEGDLTWNTIKPIVLDGITTGLEALNRAQEVLMGELVRSAVHLFRKGAFKVLSNMLLLLNVFPGLGLSSCASLLQEHASQLRANPSELVRQRLGETGFPNFLRSIEEFARRSMQISMIQERKIDMKRIDLENVIRFGINLSGKLLNRLKL